MAQPIHPLLYSRDSFLSWATRVSKTQISTDNRISLLHAQTSSDIFTLEGVFRTVQSLGVPRCPPEKLTYLDSLGEGGTFNVAKCRYEGKIVAVKYIKLGENADARRFTSLDTRLRSVLQEVCIMFHEPLANHPTILSLLGYGWQLSGGAPLPCILVEYGECGSLRSWLRNQSESGIGWLRAKIILAGDVAAGLMALHQCEIAHGDLKLDNVIVFGGRQDRPVGVIAKIADFGHSILTSPEENKRAVYYGTSLYNAPEVFMQETIPIEPKQIHKCDIWAFALLVWEVLADGEWYFKYSWRHDPTYARISNATSNDPYTPIQELPGSMNHPGNHATIEPEDSHVFGGFDVRHLRALAKDFVNKSWGAEAQFEKSYLRPFFERTLQIEARNRPSDLARLPIMQHWNQSGNARLRSKLAMQLKASKLSFDMFRIESAPEFSWLEQKGLLEDIQRIANWQQGGIRSSIATYQTALCYLCGFGTTTDTARACFYLHQAAGTSHPLALLFNARIFSALGGKSMACHESYASLLSQNYRQRSESLPDVIKEVRLQCLASSTLICETAYVPHLSYPEFLATLPALLRAHDRPNISGLRVCLNGRQVVLTLPEAAILSGDDDLTDWLFGRLPISALGTLGSKGEPPIIQACKAGKARTVCAMLKLGADPCARSTENCTLLHWLFCIEDDLASVEEALQPWQKSLKSTLDLPCTEVLTIHHQWPLRLHGTPLAFATMACCHAVVEALLKLGANPTARAFTSDAEEALCDWTPLHLAIKYRLPSICCAMLKRSGSLISGSSSAKCPKITFASALSFSSMVEQYCIHGEEYSEALDRTISCLPRTWFSMLSMDGRTPLMQAIDYEDIATLTSLLSFFPELAVTPLIDPEDRTQYTYPIHFACQLAGQRDHPGVLGALRAIAAHNGDALIRKDSRGRTCLHMAAAGVSELLVDWLLTQGASVHSIDHGGRSVLFAANSLPIFSKLLKEAKDLTVRDGNGLSLAHYAVLNDRLDILKELMNLKAPIDLNCSSVGTPLHCAILNGLNDHVSTLLGAGSHDIRSGPDAHTLLKLTIKSGNADVAREMIHCGLKIKTKFLMDDFDMLDRLLEDQNTALLKAFVDDFKSRVTEVQERALLLHYLAWRGDSSSTTLLHQLIARAPSDVVWHEQRDTVLTTVLDGGWLAQSKNFSFWPLRVTARQTQSTQQLDLATLKP